VNSGCKGDATDVELDIQILLSRLNILLEVGDMFEGEDAKPWFVLIRLWLQGAWNIQSKYVVSDRRMERLEVCIDTYSTAGNASRMGRLIT
jgi:hypothetical protein